MRACPAACLMQARRCVSDVRSAAQYGVLGAAVDVLGALHEQAERLGGKLALGLVRASLCIPLCSAEPSASWARPLASLGSCALHLYGAPPRCCAASTGRPFCKPAMHTLPRDLPACLTLCPLNPPALRRCRCSSSAQTRRGGWWHACCGSPCTVWMLPAGCTLMCPPPCRQHPGLPQSRSARPPPPHATLGPPATPDL